MKKLLCNKKIWIVAVSVIVAGAISIGAIKLFWNSKHTPDESISFYGFSERVNEKEYLPEAQAKKVIDEKNGYCFHIDVKKYYHAGQFFDTTDAPLYKDGESLVLDGEILESVFGVLSEGDKISIENAAELIKKEYVIFDDKMVIFADDAKYIDLNNSYYSLQMMSMLLKGVSAEDLKNAFVDLPFEMTNDKNFVVKYNAPELDLGLQTTLYGLQLKGENVVSKSPRIVAGEGAHKDNHTVVRVFNEYQTKVCQFLAYPNNVLGGVKVKGAQVIVNDTVYDLIVTAACNGKYNESRSVRVFDEYGILYMEIIPDFAGNAPYNIVVGDFSEMDGDELLVASESTDSEGNIRYAVYSLSEPLKISDGILSFGKTGAGLKSDVSVIVKGSSPELIFFFEESNKGYLCNLNDGNKVSAIGFELPIDANGIYASAFSKEGYVITLDENTLAGSSLSFVKLYDKGELFGDTLNVGNYENLFFWDCNYFENVNSNFNFESLYDSDYIKRAEYLHVRTDLRSQINDVITSGNVSDAEYSKWSTMFTEAPLYDLRYNVWAPCYSNKWSGTSFMSSLIGLKDEQGNFIYSAVRKDGEMEDVYGDGSLLTTTYAGGIYTLDKLRVYPLRNYLGELFVCFENDPEKLVALDLVNDNEFNVSGSVGDYNQKMIEGFRSYLINRFGSLENINKKFGTSFESESDIDAPRDGAFGDRGKWDLYKGAYFQQWCFYLRQVLNERIAESYREALLAGFPPEVISGSSNPDVDAKLSDNYRISPVDTLMTMGCSYGASKYGVWFSEQDNFLMLAKSAGFNNTSMSQYSSATTSVNKATKQLEYMHRNGVKFVNITGYDNGKVETDLKALAGIIKNNHTRNGNVGGTKGSVPVINGENSYNIIQLGSEANDGTVLKSVADDGTWEGSVYLTPFHSHVEVEYFGIRTNPRTGESQSVLTEINAGDMLDINFDGYYRGKGTAKLHIEVYEDEILNEALSQTFVIDKDTKNLRYVLSNQLPLGKINVRARFECDEYNDVIINKFYGTVQRESVARTYFDDFTAVSHKGGVNFDVLPGKSETK